MQKCDMDNWLKTSSVANEVRAERARQNERWGEQNHPDGTREQYSVVTDMIREKNDDTVRDGVPISWMDILWEEVAEAFAESDPEKLRAELIQVAAVACAWVESIDRREVL